MYEREIFVIKALANGVNYFTGESCAQDSVLNDPNVIRVLFEVCDILRDEPKRNKEKTKFSCPEDIEEKYVYEGDLSLSAMLKKIGELYPDRQRPKFEEVSNLLVEKGMLEVELKEGGKTSKIATPAAKQYGIFNVKKSSMYGTIYTVVTYNKEGQKYVLSILKEMGEMI